jgi:AcrR family transcriptional regulator
MASKVYSRDMIIKKAFQLSLEKGIFSISMRGVARKLGCSVMPIYDSFDSKEELIEELSNYAINETFRDFYADNFTERHLMMLEFGLKFPKFYLDFVKLNVMNKANDEMFENLIAIMKNDSRMKDLKTVDLLNINGQVEMFIVGVVYVYSLKGKVSDALVGDLKEATRKFIYNFIKGYVESKNNS